MTAPPLGELALGLAKIHVLYHAARGEVYGLWLLEELSEHGYRLSPGTLYPMLARMRKNGWLVATTTGGPAKARHSYRISGAGRRVLRTLRTHVLELYREVVLGDESESSSHRGRRGPSVLAHRREPSRPAGVARSARAPFGRRSQ